MKIGTIRVPISICTTGIYLRWWMNGWHYFNFTNGYEILMSTQSMGTQVTRFFSVISKVERPTRIKSDYSYKISLEGISAGNIGGFTGMLLAEKVEQYEDLIWREVFITRDEHLIRDAGERGFEVTFEITREELPNKVAVGQKSLRLYLGDVLCDMDKDEVVPLNKQTNDIAEMRDRQADFTAQFKIRKTRAMRALFELSGEVGASTNFPYETKVCKLVQDNIEVITGGILNLDDVDDQYYYVSILSGNKNFFNEIEGLKLTDLTLASTNHTWNVATMAGTHAADLDYVYPLLEPSDDGGIIPITDNGTRCELYGGWVWPFIKIKAIWDEIISNSGYIVTGGDILSSDDFAKLYMPICSREITDTAKYLYSMFWGGALGYATDRMLGEINFPGVTVIKGDSFFQTGYYYAPYDGSYKLTANIIAGTLFSTPPTLTVYVNGAPVGTMTVVSNNPGSWKYEYEAVGVVALQPIIIVSSPIFYYYWSWGITEIRDALISYGSIVEPRLYLPNMSQVEFVKMVCNMFALIPETNPRDKKVRFWNFSELYDNISIARNWSAYLSERDDKTGFQFGDYARENYLRYKDSDDVSPNEGTGIMEVNDQTLPESKDMIELPVSTCDRIRVLSTNFEVEVSRINFNLYNQDTAVYDSAKKVDPRIVYIDHTTAIASPPYEKTLGLRATVAPGATTDIDSPKKASSLEVSFSSLIFNYASLSRMLTKTNLRRCFFNLPVYEVSGLKHNIPIYLSQYKAYFYVNKINNYVPGQLCGIDLIKL